MDAVKATWHNGQILPLQPVSWPEGSELLVEPLGSATEKVGLDESEWSDDDAAMADWNRWLSTMEPPILADEERSQFESYERQFREHNRNSVREHMNGESIE